MLQVLRIKVLVLCCLTMGLPMLLFSQDSWFQLADYDGGKREAGIAFGIGDKAYAGLGLSVDSEPLNDMKMYDPVTNTWNEISPFPGEARLYAATFVIDHYGYVFGGMSIGSTYNDCWRYNSIEDSWESMADFPGEGRIKPGTFTALGKGYVVCGNELASEAETWEYDPVLNSWDQKTDFPGVPRVKMMSFGINDIGYVGLGGGGFGPFQNDLYAYNPVTNEWTEKAPFPYDGMGLLADFVIDDLAYLATGMNGTDWFTDYVVRYNPSTDEWEVMDFFSGEVRHHCSGFSIGNKGYVVFGHLPSTFFTEELWEYTPPESTSSLNEQMEENSIVIFPNPSKGSVNIHAEQTPLKIELVNSIGKVQEISGYTAVNNTISINPGGSGVYFARLYYQTGVVIKKIIIQ